MISLFDNLWLDSLVGLALIVLMTIINLAFMRRQTVMVAAANELAACLLGVVLFGWPCVIYSFVFVFILFLARYRRASTEEVFYDYAETIFSFSALFNKLLKPKKGEIVVGHIMPVNKYEIAKNMRPICMNDTILSGATLCTGATGSGKTTTLKSIMFQNIDLGKPVVFVDFKGETEILDEIEGICQTKEIPYYEFSARTCNFSYDPLVNLNETGRVEALMNTRRWDASGADEHYKTSTQLLIQNVIHAYDEHRQKIGDSRNYLVGLRDFMYSYKPEPTERDGFNTLVKQLEILLSSKAKEMLYGNPRQFSFETDKQFVICFSFTSANKALANSMSSFIFQDIMDRGTRHHYDPKLLLCIDEFGTLESSTLIKDILEKGRSGGCQTVFSILDVNQIAMNAGEHFVNAILGTINSFIIHAGATQQTADLLAGVQKFANKGYSIMDLRKPYNGKAPTALFISKYALLSKKGNQEVYRIIPYSYKVVATKKSHYIDANQSGQTLLNGEVIHAESDSHKDALSQHEDSGGHLVDNIDEFL